MISTKRNGTTEYVESPYEQEMQQNVKTLLSSSKKKKGKLNKKVDINPEDYVIKEPESPDGFNVKDPNNLISNDEGEVVTWRRTETKEDYEQRVRMMNALNEQFRHEDHRMTLEEFEAKFPEDYFMTFDELDHIITEREIDRQIEHFDECVKGKHGHQAQRWAQVFGTMAGFKGKYW